MREIKFRAYYENVMRGKKVGDDIVWSRVSYYDYDPIIDNKGLCDVEAGWDIQGHENKNDYILEQYTGLKDKNGKEIYEGDILKIEAYGRNFQVVYRKWDCSFVCENDEDEEIYSIFDGFSDKYEIIGNIHENPELLGAE